MEKLKSEIGTIRIGDKIEFPKLRALCGTKIGGVKMTIKSIGKNDTIKDLYIVDFQSQTGSVYSTILTKRKSFFKRLLDRF